MICDLKNNATITADVNAQDVFLVSGGGRGVTASCIIEMAAKFKNKFILIGRSDISQPLPEYAAQATGEADLKALIMNNLKATGQKADINSLKKIYNTIVAKQEIDETLAKIQAAGGEVVYLSGDVNDLSSLRGELQQISNRWGAITGVIHGAGRLADKLIQNKTEEDFRNVLSVKLDGLLSLLKAVDIHKLKHLVLFSSVAGFYGNLGQTDYAIANEILSKAAHLFRRNHPNTKVSAINWGAWEGGMVSPELKKKFLEAGVVLVNHAGGAAMFVNEFNQDYNNQPQVIIGGTLPTPESSIGTELKTYRIERKMSLSANPFVHHHTIQGNPVLPVVNAAAWMADTCGNLYPDFKLYKMENLQLFKGIVFDGSEKEIYYTEIKEISKTAEYIRFEVAVVGAALVAAQSDTKFITNPLGQPLPATKLPTFHYKSIVTLRNKKTALAPEYFMPDTEPNFQPTDGAILYQDGSLFHGKYYQGIEQILAVGDNYMVMRCKANAVPLEAQGQFPIQSVNTFFLDIQYQGMVVWVEKYHNGAKSLPLKTALATVYKDLPFDKTLFVHIDITENTDFKMEATCVVYDETGLVYLRTEGAAVTVSPQLQW